LTGEKNGRGVVEQGERMENIFLRESRVSCEWFPSSGECQVREVIPFRSWCKILKKFKGQVSILVVFPASDAKEGISSASDLELMLVRSFEELVRRMLASKGYQGTRRHQ
jgi:hypothetical protein